MTDLLFLWRAAQLASELGKRGAESAQPYLKRLYRTRMTAYRDAIKEFSIGFGEGLTQPTEESADAAKEREKGDEHRQP